MQLGEQPALADARLADDERHPAATGADDVEERRELSERLVAPDHRAVEPDRREAAPARRRRLAADHPVGVDRLGLALDLDLAEVVEIERVAGEAARHLGDRGRSRAAAAVCIRAATFTASPRAVYS